MDNLGIDLKLFIAQIINFGLFYLIFKKYIAKPFSELVKEEEANEIKKNKLTNDLKKQEEDIVKRETQQKERLLKMEETVLMEIKEETESLKKDILVKADLEAQKIKEKARKEIEYEKGALLQETKNKIVSTSLLIVNKILEETLTDDVKKKYTDMVIKNLPKT